MDKREEILYCVLVGIFFAFALIGVMMGDGNKGLLDLF